MKEEMDDKEVGKGEVENTEGVELRPKGKRGGGYLSVFLGASCLVLAGSTAYLALSPSPQEVDQTLMQEEVADLQNRLKESDDSYVEKVELLEAQAVELEKLERSLNATKKVHEKYIEEAGALARVSQREVDEKGLEMTSLKGKLEEFEVASGKASQEREVTEKEMATLRNQVGELEKLKRELGESKKVTEQIKVKREEVWKEFEEYAKKSEKSAGILRSQVLSRDEDVQRLSAELNEWKRAGIRIERDRDQWKTNYENLRRRYRPLPAGSPDRTNLEADEAALWTEYSNSGSPPTVLRKREIRKELRKIAILLGGPS